MTSTAHKNWEGYRTSALDEIKDAHRAVGGIQRGRRYATQQVNQAYAVILASQFQGFCRDLHSECVDHIVETMNLPEVMQNIVWAEFTRNRQLNRGNAHPDNLGKDFGSLGISFWGGVESHGPRCVQRKARLVDLNKWRNAIVHQDFNPAKLGGDRTTLTLVQVQEWRKACNGLAKVFDVVMRQYLRELTKQDPW